MHNPSTKNWIIKVVFCGFLWSFLFIFGHFGIWEGLFGRSWRGEKGPIFHWNHYALSLVILLARSWKNRWFWRIWTLYRPFPRKWGPGRRGGGEEIWRSGKDLEGPEEGPWRGGGEDLVAGGGGKESLGDLDFGRYWSPGGGWKELWGVPGRRTWRGNIMNFRYFL